jgi:hypothetical protein
MAIIITFSVRETKPKGTLLDPPFSDSLPTLIVSIYTSSEQPAIGTERRPQKGPSHHGAIVAIRSVDPLQPVEYRARLAHIHDLSHPTIEVERAA